MSAWWAIKVRSMPRRRTVATELSTLRNRPSGLSRGFESAGWRAARCVRGITHSREPDLSPVRKDAPGTKESLVADPSFADDPVEDNTVVRQVRHAPGPLVDQALHTRSNSVHSTAEPAHLGVEAQPAIAIRGVDGLQDLLVRLDLDEFPCPEVESLARSLVQRAIPERIRSSAAPTLERIVQAGQQTIAADPQDPPKYPEREDSQHLDGTDIAGAELSDVLPQVPPGERRRRSP